MRQRVGTCKTCGRGFTYSVVGGRRCYCDDCRPSDAKRSAQRWSEHASTRATTPQTCAKCDGIFYDKRKRKLCRPCAAVRQPNRLSCQYCQKPCAPRTRFPTCTACSRKRRAGAEATCPICGDAFCRTPNPKQAEGPETCSRECGAVLRAQNLQPRLNGEQCTIPWRECRGCETTFCDRPRSKQWCARCSAVENYQYWLGRRETLLVELTERKCVECGSAFMPERPCGQGMHRQVFCSAPCSHRMVARNRRHKKRTNGPHDTISLTLLAERDGWRCHICKRKVTSANWTMDHIIPIVHGGPHEWSNVALAHRLCNSKRGAGRIPAQLLLVG